MEKIKILQVSNRVPWPLNEGGNIGIYNYIKAYRELGHDVTFYCLDAQKHNTPIKEASSELSKYAKLYIHPIDTDINLEDAIKHLVKFEVLAFARISPQIYSLCDSIASLM